MKEPAIWLVHLSQMREKKCLKNKEPENLWKEREGRNRYQYTLQSSIN